MNGFSDILAPLRTLDLERIRGLRPNYPPVAVEINRDEMILARLKRKRGSLILEAHRSTELPEAMVGTSIFRPNLGSPEEISGRLKDLFEKTGTRPGKVSVVLPDNLAKVSVLSLPEKPRSRKHLNEIVRFKLRRSIPFRLEDSVVSFQNLPSEGKEYNVLVALMLRSVVEQYEMVFQAVGARPGLVDLCTPNLLNLCRPQMMKISGGKRDLALLNCAQTYFSLLIVRGDRLVFYRCKSYAAGEGDVDAANGVMAREVNTSLSYYQEKLGGEGIDTVFVRSVGKPLDEARSLLEELGFDQVIPVDPASALSLAEGLKLDPEIGQRIAPVVGAAAGRGR